MSFDAEQLITSTNYQMSFGRNTAIVLTTDAQSTKHVFLWNTTAGILEQYSSIAGGPWSKVNGLITPSDGVAVSFVDAHVDATGTTIHLAALVWNGAGNLVWYFQGSVDGLGATTWPIYQEIAVPTPPNTFLTSVGITAQDFGTYNPIITTNRMFETADYFGLYWRNGAGAWVRQTSVVDSSQFGTSIVPHISRSIPGLVVTYNNFTNKNIFNRLFTYVGGNPDATKWVDAGLYNVQSTLGLYRIFGRPLSYAPVAPAVDDFWMIPIGDPTTGGPLIAETSVWGDDVPDGLPETHDMHNGLGGPVGVGQMTFDANSNHVFHGAVRTIGGIPKIIVQIRKRSPGTTSPWRGSFIGSADILPPYMSMADSVQGNRLHFVWRKASGGMYYGYMDIGKLFVRQPDIFQTTGLNYNNDIEVNIT